MTFVEGAVVLFLFVFFNNKRVSQQVETTVHNAQSSTSVLVIKCVQIVKILNQELLDLNLKTSQLACGSKQFGLCSCTCTDFMPFFHISSHFWLFMTAEFI